MYLFHDEQREREWRDRATFYHENNVNVEVLTAKEAARIFETLNPQTFRGALFATDCGHVNPPTLTQASGKAAVDRGATDHTKTAIEDIVVEDGEVTAGESEVGAYEVDAILNAAGPWGSRLGAAVGADLPIELMIRRIMVTSPIETTNSPLVIDPEGRV